MKKFIVYPSRAMEKKVEANKSSELIALKLFDTIFSDKYKAPYFVTISALKLLNYMLQ